MKFKAEGYQDLIQYPCRWLYKVIGRDSEKLQQAILEIVNPAECQISFSKSSSSGKYHCLNLEVHVRDQNERNSIYLALKQHPQVKIVL